MPVVTSTQTQQTQYHDLVGGQVRLVLGKNFKIAEGYIELDDVIHCVIKALCRRHCCKISSTVISDCSHVLATESFPLLACIVLYVCFPCMVAGLWITVHQESIVPTLHPMSCTIFLPPIIVWFVVSLLGN